MLNWEQGTDGGYTAQVLRERRELEVLESLPVLQQVRLRSEGATIHMTHWE